MSTSSLRSVRGERETAPRLRGGTTTSEQLPILAPTAEGRTRRLPLRRRPLEASALRATVVPRLAPGSECQNWGGGGRAWWSSVGFESARAIF